MITINAYLQDKRKYIQHSMEPTEQIIWTYL